MLARLEPELARLLARKRRWSEAEYLNLDTNARLEFVDGRIEVLPMVTESHQLIMMFLYHALYSVVLAQNLGLVLPSGIPLRLWPGRLREPDILYLSNERYDRRGEKFWSSAELAMEIVSPSGRKRDLVVKREEYARAGIREYWVVDPKNHTILVLVLRAGRYEVHGEFGAGTVADSDVIPGFAVSVDEVFAAADV